TATGGAAATLTVTFPGQIHSVRINQGPMAFDDFTFDGLQGTAAGPIVVDQTPPRSLDPVSSVRVTFDRAIDVSTFTPAKITSFIGPLGDIPVTGVTVVPGSGNRQFDIAFPVQTVTGVYTMEVGPDIRDLAGNPMDQDLDGTPGQSGDAYLAIFGIEGPRIVASSPSGTVAGPVGSVRVTFNKAMDA